MGASVIETMGGGSDDDAAGGDDCEVALGGRGISHGRGMRSSEEGAVIFLMGGNGISSGVGDLFHGVGITGVAPLVGGDSGSGTSMGSSTFMGNRTSAGSSTFMSGGSYCSIDEYSRRCNPQGTRGSGGVSTWGGSIGGGLGGIGMNGGTNGDGFIRGNEDAIAGADDGGFGIVVTNVVPPVPPEGPGEGMKTGDGDLLLIILLRPLRRA